MSVVTFPEDTADRAVFKFYGVRAVLCNLVPSCIILFCLHRVCRNNHVTLCLLVRVLPLYSFYQVNPRDYSLDLLSLSYHNKKACPIDEHLERSSLDSSVLAYGKRGYV